MAGKDFTMEIMGQQVDAYVSGGDQGGAPGVLMLHPWWGLTPWFKGLCDRVAAEGCVVVAANMFGTKTADTIEGAQALVDNSDQALAQAVAEAGLARLRELVPSEASGGLAAIGFSYGAWWAAQLAADRPDDVSAVVLFYGTVGTDFAASKAAYLGHFAETDSFEPLDGVREMEAEIRAAGREVTIHVYPGTGHWFFEDNRPDAYDAGAANLAWTRTIEFLKARRG